MNFYTGASSIIMLIIILGLYHRHDRKKHIALMSLAFVLDIALVLVIELNRHAVEKVLAGPDTALLAFHVAVSLLVVVLYIAQFVTGYQLKNGLTPSALTWHRGAAAGFIVCRLLNYVTSFWVVS